MTVSVPARPRSRSRETHGERSPLVSSMSTDASSLLLTDANGRGGGQPQRDYLGRLPVASGAGGRAPATAYGSERGRASDANQSSSSAACVPTRVTGGER
jgi:hypothetical protein